MSKLSMISHFYNHPHMVEQQIAYWETLPDSLLSQLEFIVVDDCSEDTPAMRPTKLDLRLFRVTSDLPWNQAGARNLGAFNARGPWAMFFDIDQRFYPEPLQMLVHNLERLDPMGLYYLKIKELIDITVNKSLDFHPNTFLANLPMFKQHAMYDEDFVGHYGYEDLYMPQVWERRGGKRVLLNDTVFVEDLGFGTGNLNRDLSRNLALAQQKIAAGCPRPQGILRFEWEELSVPKIQG